MLQPAIRRSLRQQLIRKSSTVQFRRKRRLLTKATPAATGGSPSNTMMLLGV